MAVETAGLGEPLDGELRLCRTARRGSEVLVEAADETGAAALLPVAHELAVAGADTVGETDDGKADVGGCDGGPVDGPLVVGDVDAAHAERVSARIQRAAAPGRGLLGGAEGGACMCGFALGRACTTRQRRGEECGDEQVTL